ncbi:unnamed protein product [Schistocephalus solidus]|uniref:Uncharacterized protein n=1 Tax=Schistocephalus solidus TaxID=70667 RepID=A0A183TEB8_SCHSO|nr:unnamed protein product [Schistocephalus solidus]
MKKRWVASNANPTGCGTVMQPLAPNPPDAPLPVPPKVPIPPSLRPNFPTNQFNAIQPAGVQFMVANTKLGTSHPALRGTTAPNSQSLSSACLSDTYVPSRKRSDLTTSMPSTQNAHLLDALLVEPQMAGRNLMQPGNRNAKQMPGDVLVCQDPSSSTSGRNSIPIQRSEAASQLVISSRSPLRRSPASTTLSEVHHQPTSGVRQASFTLREFSDVSVQGLVQADYLSQQSRLRSSGSLPVVRSPGLPTLTSQPVTSSSLLQNVHQSVPRMPPRASYTPPVNYNQNSKDFLELLALQTQQLKEQKQEINPATLLQLTQLEKLRQISPNPTDAVFSAMVTLLTNALTQGGATIHTDLAGIDDQALRKQTNSSKTGYQATPALSNQNPSPQAVRDVILKNSRSKTFGSEPPVVSGDVNVPPSSAPGGLPDPAVAWSANKLEIANLTSAANATTIDILRESKQVSMNVPTCLSSLTTSSFPQCSPFVTASVSGPQKMQTVLSSSPTGTYVHDKQPTRFLLGQTDPIDHHFQVALGKTSMHPSSAASLLPPGGKTMLASDHSTSQNCLPDLPRNSPIRGPCKPEQASVGQMILMDGSGGTKFVVKSSNTLTTNTFETKGSTTATPTPNETTHYPVPSSIVCGAFSQAISSSSALKEESDKKPNLQSASHATKRPLMTSYNSRLDDACRFAPKKRLIQRYEADGAASFCDIPTEASTNAAGGKCESADVNEKAPTKVGNMLTTTTVITPSQISESRSPNALPAKNDALSKLSRVMDDSSSFVLDRSSDQINGSLSEIVETNATNTTASKKVSKQSKTKTTGGPVAAPTTVQSRRQPPVRATKIALMNTVSLKESAKPARLPKGAGLPRTTKATRRPAANAAAPPHRSDPTTITTASPTGLLGASPLGLSRNRSSKTPRFFTRHRETETDGQRRRTASLCEDGNSHPNSPLPDGSGAAAYAASLHDFDFDASESSPAANSTTSSACASSAAGKTQSSRSIPRKRVGGSGVEDGLSPDQKRRTTGSRHQLRTSKSTRSPAVPTPPFKLGTPERNLRKPAKPSNSSAEAPVRRRPTRPKTGINAEPSYVENFQDDFSSGEEVSAQQPIAERRDDGEQHEGALADEEDIEEKTDEMTNGRAKTRLPTVCRKCAQRFEPYGYSLSGKTGSSQTDCYDFQCDDNLSTEELLEALPPPPDPSQAEGETFLQLNSCSDLEKLKPSLRCRACREVNRTGPHQGTDVNSSPASASLKVSNNRRRGHNKQSATSHVSVDAHNGNGAKYSAQKAVSSSSAAAAAQQNTISVFCRFWGFRKLAYDNKGVLSLTDFCRTVEADRIDRSLWSMHRNGTCRVLCGEGLRPVNW